MAPGQPSKLTQPNKYKASGAERRAVRRETPTLKLIAATNPGLQKQWKKAGGDPYEWRGVDEEGESYARVEVGEKGVRELVLDDSSIQGVPGAIGKLRSLRNISLVRCYDLVDIGAVVGCSALDELYLRFCYKISVLPDGLGSLRALTYIDLEGCYNLSALPDSIGNLNSLTFLDVSSCGKLTKLPDALFPSAARAARGTTAARRARSPTGRRATRRAAPALIIG